MAHSSWCSFWVWRGRSVCSTWASQRWPWPTFSPSSTASRDSSSSSCTASKTSRCARTFTKPWTDTDAYPLAACRARPAHRPTRRQRLPTPEAKTIKPFSTVRRVPRQRAPLWQPATLWPQPLWVVVVCLFFFSLIFLIWLISFDGCILSCVRLVYKVLNNDWMMNVFSFDECSTCHNLGGDQPTWLWWRLKSATTTAACGSTTQRTVNCVPALVLWNSSPSTRPTNWR